MTSIQLQIIRSGGQVHRETFSHGPVAFGREAGNQIIFAESYVSRNHGTFFLNHDRWMLENHSDNGTHINGKRIRKQPVPVHVGDIITIGDQEIFRIEALNSDIKPEAAGADTPVSIPIPTPASATSKKTRLWLSLAGFWVVVLAILVFVQPLLVSSKNGDTLYRTPELTRAQISQCITRKPSDIAGNVTPDERKMNEALALARSTASRLDARIDAPFVAYRAYQRALAYSGKNLLDDSKDQRDFTMLEVDITEEVIRRYYDAYAKLRTQNFREADQAFQQLSYYFPETDNPLIKNVEAHRRDMGPKLKRRR